MNQYLLKTLFLAAIPIAGLRAQTDIDGIMMAKKNLCAGVVYQHSAWKHYWEGTLYRENLNLGTVSSTMPAIMANYGISNRLNVIVGLPYVKTNATAGTLHGMSGLQDFSLWGKFRFLQKEIGKNQLSLFAVGGFQTPMSQYPANYMPLSLGFHSTNGIYRLLADVERNRFYITASGSYIRRSNITMDCVSYYTTEMHYTNKLALPDVWTANLRLGYRKDDLILELVADRYKTIGGFDIRRNDMPFPSNNIQATRAGVNIKLPVPKVSGLAVVGNSFYTLAGRNVGRSFSWMGGIFYVMDLNKKGAAK